MTMPVYTSESRFYRVGRAACKNLLGFVILRPPCVVFIIFIGAFALGFLSLAYYVQNSNLVDAEATKGWAQMYSNLSSLTFCISNTTLRTNWSAKSSADNYMSTEMANVSLPFNVLIKQVPLSSTLNTSELIGTIPYFFLDLADEHKNPYIRIQLASELLLGTCMVQNEYGCSPITLNSCVTITLPKSILPSPVPPLTCNASSISFGKPVEVFVLKPSKENGKVVRSTCEENIEITLIVQEHFDTNVFVSMAEKSQINLRLQIAAYFLFVLLLSMILYALLKGRPHKTGIKMFVT